MRTGDIRRVEGKLAQVLATANCPTCAQRVDRCPHCGARVGGLRSEAEFAARHLHAKLDDMGRRMAMADTLAAALVEEDLASLDDDDLDLLYDGEALEVDEVEGDG